MTRATEDILDQLHLVTAEALLEEIRKYKAGEVLDEDGNPVPLPAALVTAAIKFLKDNGVDRPLKQGDAVDLLSEELPDLPDNVTPFRKTYG